MRIGVDGSSLLNRRSGIGRYTLNLIRAMSELSPSDRFVVFAVSLRNRLPPDLFEGLSNVTLRNLPISSRAFYLSAFWTRHPRIDRWLGGIDLLHSTNYFVYPLRNTPQVVTVHDLHFMRQRRHATSLGGRLWGRSLARDLRRADRVLAVSDQTRRDVLRTFDCTPDQVVTVHEGVAGFFLEAPPDGEVAAVSRSLGLEPGRYLFWVGTFEPRKNLERLVDAYRSLHDGRHPAPPPLVLAGQSGFGCEELLQRLDSDPVLRRSVIRPGFVDDRQLRALYHGAAVFVFPSLWEGFGLPPLEAMACGAPVVASDRSAIPEVLGDAYVGVPPEDPAALAQALRGLLSSDARRAELRVRGQRIAAGFSWRRAAERTMEVYRRVLRERPGVPLRRGER